LPLGRFDVLKETVSKKYKREKSAQMAKNNNVQTAKIENAQTNQTAKIIMPKRPNGKVQ